MKKEQIMEVAERLFIQKGFDGTSIRDLSKEAGINVAMISYYFGSKENLLQAIVEQKANYGLLKSQEYNAMLDLTPFEKLSCIMDYYADKILNNQGYHQLLHKELNNDQRPELRGIILGILEKNWVEIRKAIQEGQDRGLFKKDIDPTLVIMTIFGFLNQCTRKDLNEKLRLENPGKSMNEIRDKIKNHLSRLLKDHLTNY